MEVLAPVGNKQCFEAALSNGADAVYLALTQFGARAKAENFSPDDLKPLIERAHLFGIKVYLTFNTLMKDNELAEAVRLIKHAADCKADAFILQDYGLIERLKREVPGIEMHASTQMGVHNAEGAIALERLGFKRVILSRETTLKDILKIKKATTLEIEVFVHGALCVAFSGNCYFSSLVSGYSGNRGKCLQLCRKLYTYGKNKGYYLSTKDLCLYDQIAKLKDAGVDSVKIEGRMRRPEYVAAACIAYKNAVSGHPRDEDVETLKRIFNRGDYCTAYLESNRGGVLYPKAQGNIGIRKGKVLRIESASAVCDCVLHTGDGVKFMRDGMESGGASIRADGVITGFSGEVKAGDEVRLTTDSQFNSQLLGVRKYLEADAKILLEIGRKPIISLTYKDLHVQFQFEYDSPKGNNSYVSEAEIKESFCKKSDDVFAIKVQEIILDGKIFIPKSIQNEMRRMALRKLKEAVLARCESRMPMMSSRFAAMRDIVRQDFALKPAFTMLQVSSYGQLNSDILSLIDYLVLKPDVYDEEKFKKLPDLKIPVFLSLPLIARDKDMEKLKAIIGSRLFFGYIINNPYGFTLCEGENVLLGTGLNLLNDETDFYKIKSVESERFSEADIGYVYGKVPLMTLTHCPALEAGESCGSCKGAVKTICDERGNRFKLRNYKIDSCYHELLNCHPLNLTDIPLPRRFIDGIDCTSEQIVKVLRGRANGEGIMTRGNYHKVLY